MNSDMIGGVFRALAPPFITYAVAKGIIPAGDWMGVIAAVSGVVAMVWSIYTNKTGKTIGPPSQ